MPAAQFVRGRRPQLTCFMVGIYWRATRRRSGTNPAHRPDTVAFAIDLTGRREVNADDTLATQRAASLIQQQGNDYYQDNANALPENQRVALQ